MQLHPGDLGWHWRFGAEATAAAVRTWSRGGQVLAVGLLDGPALVRVAIAPDAQHDEELAAQMVVDVTPPDHGVLPRGSVSVEVRSDGLFKRLLLDDGWGPGDAWTPLRRDLAEPVEDCGLQVEVIVAARAHVRAAVQRAAFSRSTFTEQRWRAMAAGPPYADARCLVAYEGHSGGDGGDGREGRGADEGRGAAAAAATVWSAGPGRPGLLEPVGVHRDHRGHGYGTAITLAAAVALRGMGSSSAIVCTESSNVGAVATYRSAGFEQLPDVPDLHRRA